MSTNEPLTKADVLALHVILAASQGTKRVSWLAEDGSIVTGVARSITDEHGNFIHDSDIRDAFLWTSDIVERFTPVKELVRLIKRNEFVVED